MNKIKQGLKLTAKELSGYQELVAHDIEELLGNETSIERLSRNNTGLARKIYNKIRDILFAIKGTNAEKATVERLKKAEKLFARSLTAIGVLDDGNELDNSGEIRYSKKGYSHRNPNTVTQNEYEHHYWAIANNLLSKEELGMLDDAVANIYRGEYYEQNSDGFYMIPVGENGVLNKIVFTDGKYDAYSIDTVIEINDNIESNLIEIRRLIYEGERYGFHTQNSNLFQRYYRRNYSYSNFVGKLQKNSQNSNGKQNGRGSSSKTKIYLEDSNGNRISEEQDEYFKDSKVRDDDGNLLVMYHGSKADAYEFDKKYISSWNMFGKGFYFTSIERFAKKYATASLKEVYLNIKNPFIATKRVYLDKLYQEINNSKKDIEEYSVEHGIKGEEFIKICNYLNDIGADIQSIMQSLGYDGIIYEHIGIVEVVAYESNQIKLTTNKNPTTSNDIRFSLKDKADINLYTEKQYNDFGWARVNGVLTTNENENFKTKYNAIKYGNNQNIHKTFSGGYIVETNNMAGEDFAVNNVLVYAKGPFGEPKISKVIKINLDNETAIELVRDTIYEYETNRRKQAYTASEIVEACFGEELISEFKLGDFPGYQEIKAERSRQFGRDDGFKNNEYNQREFDGERNLDEDSGTIKFSRKANPTYTLSDGQVKKKVANFTKLKVYSKVEAERVINSILDSNLGFEDYDISISGKNKAEVIDVLWKTLNTADSGKRTGISLKIADYIIDNAVMENIYQEDENDIHLETIKYLKPYLHKINLDGIKGEIKYRYDNDNSIYLLWGKRKGEKGQSANQIAMELAVSGFFIDAENEADIFFEMDRAYREAVRALKKKSDKFLADTLGKEEDKISLAWYKWIQDEIHKVGGIAIYPHPLWVYPGLDRYHIRQSVAQEIYEKGYCDFFEMFGGVDDVNRKLHELLYFELCEKGKKYPFVASSDAHGCLHHNQYYFDQAWTIVFADTVENIPQSILNGYTTAVDNQKTDNRTVYGNVRLAQYTYFLLGAYYEYHDALCNAIGQAFLRYVSGDTSQNALIESLENELVKFNTDFFGR